MNAYFPMIPGSLLSKEAEHVGSASAVALTIVAKDKLGDGTLS